MTSKKILLSLFSMTVAASMFACASGNNPSTVSVNSTSNLSYLNKVEPGTEIDLAQSQIVTNNVITTSNPTDIKQVTQAVTKTIFLGDVGQGKKGGNISVVLGFDSSFKTQATADGTAPKTSSDITHARLTLTTDSSNPTTGAVFTSSVLTYSGSSKTYTFANVPTGGPYFVAVELFDNVSAASSANLIEPSDASTVTVGTKFFTVSSSPTASVTVDSTNKVSTTSALTIFPKLKAGVGATIDATVQPADGNSTNGSISAS